METKRNKENSDIPLRRTGEIVWLKGGSTGMQPEVVGSVHVRFSPSAHEESDDLTEL